MRTEPLKRHTKNLLICLLNCAAALVLGMGCTPPEGRDFKQGQKEARQGQYALSLSLFEHSMKRNPTSPWAMKSAHEGARIAFFETKDFKKAAQFYRHIVVNSTDSQERIEAQQKLAEVYLDNLQDYPQAIVEYSKLVEQNLSDQNVGQDRLGLARAHYFQNNLFQADSELTEILKLKVEPPLRFNALMLKGNILIAQKDFSKAAALFKELIKDYPEKAQHENVPLTLAVCFEEAGELKEALVVLESLRKTYQPPEYIELRIKRLKERQKNQPGAKGFRK